MCSCCLCGISATLDETSELANPLSFCLGEILVLKRLPHFCSQEPLGLPLNFSKLPVSNSCSSWEVVQRCGSCPNT